MNTANIDKLINHLQKVQAAGKFNTFKMNGWFFDHDENKWPRDRPHYETKLETETPHHECGAVACIAGHAAICMVAEGIGVDDIQKSARDWLDLDYNEHIQLFLPNVGVGYENISIADAIQVLETLRDTGDINWKFVDERSMANS